jgi:hypothetical protein
MLPTHGPSNNLTFTSMMHSYDDLRRFGFREQALNDESS